MRSDEQPDSRVWIIYCEVESITDEEHRGFVEAYVPVSQVQDALSTAEELIARRGFRVLDIDQCVIYCESQWNDEDDPDGDVRDCSMLAHYTQRPVLGEIRRYYKDRSG